MSPRNLDMNIHGGTANDLCLGARCRLTTCVTATMTKVSLTLNINGCKILDPESRAAKWRDKRPLRKGRLSHRIAAAGVVIQGISIAAAYIALLLVIMMGF